MFNLFSKKPSGNVLTLKIDGMHCTSCSMNIDGALEDLDGVIKSSTSYSKSETTVEYNSNKINQQQILDTIKATGYTVNKQEP